MDERHSMSGRHESRKAVERLRQKIALLKNRSAEKFDEMREIQQRIEKLAFDLARARANQTGANRHQGQPGKRGQTE
jgi:hypothetical protein